ncbi:MAG: branched-chain amino acid transport system II carrier protein [Proteobacteria bacterium]|nr:branched-chain amino acid transport system II carrier protein [Pseudomonadota bacterium]
MLKRFCQPILHMSTWETGLAIFSMFFGAGNVVFPLIMGRDSGNMIWVGIIGLMLTAVLGPLLGLYATILQEGQAGKLFFKIGRFPGVSLMIIGLVMLGPFAIMPRCFTVAYGALTPYFPSLSLLTFTIISGILTLACIFRREQVLAILGYILSPALVICLLIIIYFGLTTQGTTVPVNATAGEAFKLGFEGGYYTLDLMCSIYYCAATWALLKFQKDAAQKQGREYSVFLTCFWASVISVAFLAIIYLGLAFSAAKHNAALFDVERAQILIHLSLNILHPNLALVSNMAIALACFTTALGAGVTFADIVCDEIERSDTFKHLHIPYLPMSAGVVIVTVLLANLGFEGLMKFIEPLVQAIYPSVVALAITSIIEKVFNINIIKISVLLTFVATLVFYYVL